MVTNEIQTLLADIRLGKTHFKEVIAFIDDHYTYQPTRFVNGDVISEAGINEGSAKVFGFGLFNNLSKEDTLRLFAEHYQSVLATPDATVHTNIRQFMKTGWERLEMNKNCLTAKP